MSAGLLLYAVAGTLAIVLMVGAIVLDAHWMWCCRNRPTDPDPRPWYAAALAVTVGLFLLGALWR